jgi:predicted dehydrogenase
MDRRDLGFGVVGLGMGGYHCHALTGAKGCRLVAACDLDLERLQPIAEKYQVKAYDSYADMLRDPAVDVVCVATPSGMHADMALQAVAAGRHVVVEKPVDVRPDKIRRLSAALKAANLKGTGIFQSRTDPLNRRIRTAIQAGRLGRLIGVHAVLPWYRAQSYYEGKHGTWRGTWAMDGGGSLMNQGVHTVDLMQWFGGRVQSVFGFYGVFAHQVEAEDKTAAVLRFANGALGTLTTTTAAFGGDTQIFLIHGNNGTIQKAEELRSWRFLDDKDGTEAKELLALYGPKESRPQGPTVATDPMAVGSTGHKFQFEDLVEAIWEKRDPYITIDSAMHAVEIINAIYESGRTGKAVELG